MLSLALFYAAELVVAAPKDATFAAKSRRQTQLNITSTLIEPEVGASTFFSTADVAYSSTLNIDASDGDLWPTTWADDGNLYTANGDGRGFSTVQADFADIVVNSIMGTPETGITGERLAFGAELGPVWTQGPYNRKPTGIVAVDGDGDGKDELYLVVQDLNNASGDVSVGAAFNDVPAASIAKSTDYGVTWTPTAAPMFTNYTFTTVWFLDYGQSNSRASVLGEDGTKYVYAYGIDNNWRDSLNGAVEDPQDMYLARAPIASIQDISSWEWFSGTAESPAWDYDITSRRSVLTDTRREYVGGNDPQGFSVISQGSVVYNEPLDRYIYTSWTDYTFEFYEAPQPWGPFNLFHHRDFGVTPWFGMMSPNPKNGGYATTIPSKFISEDGTKMWLQSNWFVGAVNENDTNYSFSLRPFNVAKYHETTPSNEAGDTNLAVADGATPIDKASHFGNLDYLNDGATTSEDSYDGSIKNLNRWGYLWPCEYNMDRVVYTTGASFPDGGYFASGLKVQVRQSFQWVDVTGLKIDPVYPYDSSANPNRVYTFTFDKVAGDGVQIIGVPGGSSSFTSIDELEVYYDGQ